MDLRWAIENRRGRRYTDCRWRWMSCVSAGATQGVKEVTCRPVTCGRAVAGARHALKPFARQSGDRAGAGLYRYIALNTPCWRLP